MATDLNYNPHCGALAFPGQPPCGTTWPDPLTPAWTHSCWLALGHPGDDVCACGTTLVEHE